MKNFYKIAGKKITIEGADEEALDFFAGFEAEEGGETFISFRAHPAGNLEASGAEDPASSGKQGPLFGFQLDRRRDGGHLIRSPKNPRERLKASPDWKECAVFSNPLAGAGAPERKTEPGYPGLILGAMTMRGAFEGMLLLHASAVSFGGRALVFTAPSGSGKTTQAELWQRCLDAEILNGDKVFLVKREEGFYAAGSPWTGSSPYKSRRMAPLAALVVLSKGAGNRIRKLDMEETAERLFPNIFLPYWEEDCLSAALDTLDQLMKETPVFHFSCRKDETAVYTVKNAVFSGEEV
ncbi:MAG: hypothetical protein K6E30_02700 [Lachnospiraceae bacterium]|nr:hypothetical protein [Lachnospiraceae bacterium]